MGFIALQILILFGYTFESFLTQKYRYFTDKYLQYPLKQVERMSVDLYSYNFYLTVLLVFLGGLIAAAGGIGGGGVIVPILLVVGKYSYHQSTILSLCTLLGSYSAQATINFMHHHPLDKRRSLIYWDLVLVLLPAQLGGSNIGVIIAKIFPDTVLLVVAMGVLSYAIFRTVKKARYYLKQEANMKEERSINAIEGAENTTQTPLLGDHPAEDTTIYDDDETAEFRPSMHPSYLSHAIHGNGTGGGGYKPVHEGDEDNRGDKEEDFEGSYALTDCDSVKTDPWLLSQQLSQQLIQREAEERPTVYNNTSSHSHHSHSSHSHSHNSHSHSHNTHHRTVNEQKVIDFADDPTAASAIQWPRGRMRLILIVWLAYVLLFVLISLTTTSCTLQYYLLVGCIYPPIGLLILWGILDIAGHQRGHPETLLDGDILFTLSKRKTSQTMLQGATGHPGGGSGGGSGEEDIEDGGSSLGMSGGCLSMSGWCLSMSGGCQSMSGCCLVCGHAGYSMPLITGVIGILCSLLGIGGGELMGPFFLICRLLPPVSTATTATMSLLTTANNVIHYAVLGEIDYGMGGILLVTGFISGRIGRYTALSYAQKYHKQSVLVVMLSMILTISFLLLIYDIAAEEPDWEFHPLC